MWSRIQSVFYINKKCRIQNILNTTTEHTDDTKYENVEERRNVKNRNEKEEIYKICRRKRMWRKKKKNEKEGKICTV